MKDIHIPVGSFLNKGLKSDRKVVSLRDLSILVDRQAIEIINLSNLLKSNKQMLHITEMKCVNMDSELKTVNEELKKYHSLYFDLYNAHARSIERQTVSPVESLLSVSREEELEEINELCDEYEDQVFKFNVEIKNLKNEIDILKTNNIKTSRENERLKDELVKVTGKRKR